MFVVNKPQNMLLLFLRGSGFFVCLFFFFKKSETLSVAKQIFMGRINRASQRVRGWQPQGALLKNISQLLMQEEEHPPVLHTGMSSCSPLRAGCVPGSQTCTFPRSRLHLCLPESGDSALFMLMLLQLFLCTSH